MRGACEEDLVGSALIPNNSSVSPAAWEISYKQLQWTLNTQGHFAEICPEMFVIFVVVCISGHKWHCSLLHFREFLRTNSRFPLTIVKLSCTLLGLLCNYSSVTFLLPIKHAASVH